MSIRLIKGDCREILKTLPSESVHCVVTSPPYWGLRDYGVAGQIGLEPTFDQFIAEMVAVFREVRRVLRSDGTLWLNLGDSYATGGGRSIGRNDSGKPINGRPVSSKTGGATGRATAEGLKDKDLVGIPWRVAFALQADGWWLRQDIIWAKPNPMPESVTDRCTKAHEYIFLLSKSARYWFDADAIREPHDNKNRSVESYGNIGVNGGQCGRASRDGLERSGIALAAGAREYNPLGRNKRSVWEVATAPFSEAHFATFPPELIEPCIKAGCPDKCCPKCGEGWERAREVTGIAPAGNPHGKNATIIPDRNEGKTDGFFRKTYSDNGFRPTCSCPAHQPVLGTVLDPFGGAGTTGLVADRLQRNAILIELNPQYAAMAERRISGDAPLFAQVAAE